MGEVDAEHALAVARGDDAPQTGSSSTSEDPSDDGSDDGDSSSGSWVERLWDGSAPGPSMVELRAEYDLPQWALLGLRGILRTATGEGVPPIAEIVLAGVLWILEGGDGSGSSSDDGGSGGGESESFNIVDATA